MNPPDGVMIRHTIREKTKQRKMLVSHIYESKKQVKDGTAIYWLNHSKL